MALSLVERVQAIREGGAVQRCHTIYHGRPYDVAQHCYNALSLVLLLHPDPKLPLIRTVLWHDVPERWTGDVPGTLLWNHHNLRQELSRIEEKVFGRIGLDDVMVNTLDPEIRSWLIAVDSIEFFLWARETPDVEHLARISAARICELRKRGLIPNEAWGFFLDAQDRSVGSVRSQLDQLLRGPEEVG